MKVYLNKEELVSKDYDPYLDYIWKLGFHLAINNFSDIADLPYDDAFSQIKKDFICEELDSEVNKCLLDGFRMGYEQERINLKNFQTIQRFKALLVEREQDLKRIRDSHTTLLGNYMQMAKENSKFMVGICDIYTRLLRILFNCGNFWGRKKAKKELEKLIEDIKKQNNY